MGGEALTLQTGVSRTAGPNYVTEYDPGANELNIKFQDMLDARNSMRTITGYLGQQNTPGLSLSSVSMPTKHEILSIHGVKPENVDQVTEGITSAMNARGLAAYAATNAGLQQSAQLGVG